MCDCPCHDREDSSHTPAECWCENVLYLTPAEVEQLDNLLDN